MKKKNICIVTATRAEWGVMRPLAELINDDASYNLLIFATGTHYCSEFGNTYQEILSDGFNIDERIDMQLYAESPAAISKTIGLTVIGFADAFSRHDIDLLVIMGDRYEMLGVCIAAMNARIPIAHLAGGDITEGAIDDTVRHSLTKMSYLHFTSCSTSRKRVIQMGENPERVYDVGELGIDNIAKLPLLSLSELSMQLNFTLKNTEYGVVTFHPETLSSEDIEVQCRELLNALSAFPDMKFIVTKSNADEGGGIINSMMETYAQNNHNVRLVSSLGNLKFLSALKHSAMMIGNSSSGIIECPYFKIPTINIGHRQDGRLQANTIINCETNTKDIINAIQFAQSENFRKNLLAASCPYGDGHAAERILAVLHEWLDADRIDLKKKFYDMEAA